MAEGNLLTSEVVTVAADAEQPAHLSLVTVLNGFIHIQRKLEVNSELNGQSLGGFVVFARNVLRVVGNVVTQPLGGHTGVTVGVDTKAGLAELSVLSVRTAKTKLYCGACVQVRSTVHAGVTEVTVKAVHVECHVQILAVPAPICIKEAGLCSVQECIELVYTVLTAVCTHSVEQIILVIFKSLVLAHADLAVHSGGDGQIRNLPGLRSDTGLLIVNLVSLYCLMLVVVCLIDVIVLFGRRSDCQSRQQHCSQHQHGKDFFHRCHTSFSKIRIAPS